MLFNSLPFLVFLTVVLFLYYSLNHKNQNVLLLIAGLVFYSLVDWRMSLLLLVMIYFNFKLGLALVRTDSRLSPKLIFRSGIVLNLIVLGFFKYAMFFMESSNDIFYLLNIDYKLSIPIILLPIGISFYTFHNISYLFDIYRNQIQPTRSLLTFGVYDLFFPLLLAGPIERPHSLIPQIENKRKVESKDWEHGFWLFFWGVFKKVYIADNLSPFVDSALSKGTGLEAGMISWIAVCFAFQVYADFSGYTDAARGMAKMMGFRLMLNFNLPFFSTSVAEFWKRWHISLSSWLRDYLYIPLGGNKIGLLRQNTNIIIVWTLGGLWHGATYGYLVWGIYCGVCIVVYNLLNKFFRLTQIQSNLLSFIGWVLSFWSFALGLLLFRVDGYSDLLRMIDLSFGIYWNWIWFGKLVLFLFPVIVVDSIQYLRSENESFLWVQDGWATRYRHLTYPIVLSFGFILFVGFGVFEQKEFFYFQF